MQLTKPSFVGSIVKWSEHAGAVVCICEVVLLIIYAVVV